MRSRLVVPIAITIALVLSTAPASASGRIGSDTSAARQSPLTRDGAPGDDGGAKSDDLGKTGSNPTVRSSPPSSPLISLPPPVDAEIAAVLENERRAAAVEDAKAAAAAELTAANAIVHADQVLLDRAQTEVTAAQSVVASKQRALDDTRRTLSRARDAMDATVQQAVNVGVSMYMQNGATNDPNMGVAMAVIAGGDTIPDAAAVDVYRDALAEKALDDLAKARRATDRARKAVRGAEGVLRSARSELDSAQLGAENAKSKLAASLAGVESARSQGAKQIAAAQASAPALKSTELTGGLAILGEPLVPARQLAEFVRRTGRANPSIDLDELAEAYIAEGRAEGVRSDVAWVQSIIETGWFSFGGSMVRVGDHNYAGIGACDSCSRGIVFDSVADGVRTQIQLLRTYATKGLTSKDLAHPPPKLSPERSPVRGCCKTWMGLSGVWATGPGYGVKILTLYNQLLAFAAAQRLK